MSVQSARKTGRAGVRRSKLVAIERADSRQVVELACSRLSIGHSTFILTINVEIFEECVRDRNYHDALCLADIVICDGIGIALAAAAQGYQRPIRYTGIELTAVFLRESARSRVPVIVVGASAQSRTAFEQRGRDASANISVGMSPLVTNIEETADSIAHTLPSPAIVLVALGAPKQELLITAIQRRDARPRVYVGVGGAIDYLSGSARLPPAIVARLGLQWLHRLLKEPRKRLPRQIRCFPPFVLHEILFPAIALSWLRRRLEKNEPMCVK